MSEIDIFDEAWQVPARTIDMLGRQQIANIPTALHELFKNAHDAFADEVVADFFRRDGILLIRDDGDGMTLQQLQRGWLTLASSAKHGANDAPRQRADGKRLRAIMGEKGIGRLAIASIGPQVLIMTRARAFDESAVQPLLVSLVHWGMNQLPDVDLSRIVIPTLRHPSDDLPDATMIRALADRLAANVSGLRTAANQAEVEGILRDLASLDIDPRRDLGGLPGPSLMNGGTGTNFLIKPVNDMLESDLDRPDEEQVSQLEKYLLGFSNTTMPDRPRPAIIAAFNDHRLDGTIDTPIGEGAFFTPEDFLRADHAIEGTFDPFGQFQGKIRVYNGSPTEHEIHWRGAQGRPSRCGPFRINFAYLQGKVQDSRLDPQSWADMSVKLALMGGLYVYRDGIRILPYGGPEQDFIGIERRRTKSASDWFFSYRRMFGAVELSDAENRALREKAGREGFIRDQAYKDFVDILSNFFQNLAVDFFRESSRMGAWSETRGRLNQQAELLAKREKAAKHKLQRFDRQLDGVFEKLEAGHFTGIAESIKAELAVGLALMAVQPDPEKAALELSRLERRLEERLDGFVASLHVAKPRGIALNKKRANDWDSYNAVVAKVEAEVLSPLRAEIRGRVGALASERSLPLDKRKRIAGVLDRRGERARSQATKARGQVEMNLENLRQEIARTLKASVSEVASRITQTQIEFETTEVTEDEAASGLLQERWEAGIENTARIAIGRLDALSDQLGSLLDAVKRGETLDQTTEAIETQAVAYRDQLDQYVELAQLGTAVGIVQHEFSSAVHGVRRAIRRLDPWAKANPALGNVNRDLRNGFEHLDAYLNLFAPLSRRLTASKTEISGAEIEKYLEEVFRERLGRHGVKVKIDTGFSNARMMGQPSAILAAFVNLVDNAIHWTASAPVGKRVITLGTDGDGMLVSNSGPGIDTRIADRIFEYGETTRLGGRGLGLYVSREALRRSDLDLTLVEPGRSRTPAFRIGPRRPHDAMEKTS